MNRPELKDKDLNESHDLFFDMFENSAIGMIFTHADTAQFKYANKSFLNCFGFTKEELLGKTAVELGIATPEIREKILSQLNSQKVLNNFEISLKNKKGESICFLISAQIMKLGNNNYTHTSFIDITEQKKTTAELVIANNELAFQNGEKEKRAAELVIANIELEHQNKEKEKRAQELLIANKELEYQNRVKEKRAAELIIANKELAFQNEEKEKRAAELIIANKELLFQTGEKQDRADELLIANIELEFQTGEKQNRADELIIANKELVFQKDEKQNRANELVIADKELTFQNKEKEKRVSENKELEAYNYSLKLASKYARSLIEASLDPLVTINVEGKITDVNNASIKVTGVDRELLVGTDFSNYFTEPEKAQKGYRQVFENGFVEDYPLTIKHLNGKLIDVLYNASVYKDDNGMVLGVFAAARDITIQNKEKVKSEIANKKLGDINKSLKLASQYSLSLIEASRDPLFTISPKGKITDTNQASVRATEVSKEDLINTDFINYFTEPEKAKKGYEEVFSKGFVVDYPLVLKDGNLTDVLFNGAVYKDEKDNIIGAVVVARDISEQKKAEKELIEAKTYAELATSIAEEAKIIAEAATTKANEAVKSKQQFLSNMSHEIRTPMNAIIGFTKVVLKTELTAKQKEYLTAIKMSGDALIVLINDILDLAKVDAGKMTFEKTPFKLKLSIKAMLHLFETKIQEKNLKLITHYDHEIPEVLVGDPVRLHQIILNLVSNAVKFTSVGKITVSVKLVSETDDNVAIRFSIADTGIGIRETKTEKIFENFQQATSGTSRIFGGTGLGLAIVKQLVEAQNGTIDVESSIGKGSTFSFMLYFDKTHVEAVLEPEIMEIDAEIKDTKILVVEDMELNQLLMKTLLDDFGFECEIASNGKIAVEKLQKNKYDIILMDLQMPEMNGFEATEYIRQTMKLTLPIIALTADVTTVDVAKCKAVGMNDYISKPVDERLLYSKLISFIKKPVAIIESQINGNKRVQTIKYVDLSYLSQLTKANPKLMSEMIEAYLKQTPPLLLSMKQSFRDKDWQLLKATAHKIIPSFSIMGINAQYEELAKKIQDYAEKLELSTELEALVTELDKVCLQSFVELENELIHLKK